MAIIDQRILIPARQDVVWAYVSDLTNNAEWQSDCRAVSFLSTKHTGTGTRWRSTTSQGRDAVLEISSWYNGLGYEYQYVDGGAFKENLGRLRLQEIPEGTVVQWTFSFEGGGGLFGGGRATRQIDSTMAASLKALYKQVKNFTKDQNEAMVAKSLIREAPDVEARAAYKPRHPSALAEGALDDAAEGAVLLPVTSEPAIKPEDAGLVAAIDLHSEPPVAVDDTKPREPVGAVTEGDERFAPKPAPEAAAVQQAVPAPVQDLPAAPIDESSAPEEAAPEPATVVPPPAAPVDRTEAAALAAAAAAILPPADREGKSIWEVFGVQPPGAPPPAEVPPEAKSATAAETDPGEAAPEPDAAAEAFAVELAEVAETPASAVVAEAPAEAPAVPEPAAGQLKAPPIQHPRRGLRISERQQMICLRQPE